jgi:hypothetical protein
MSGGLGGVSKSNYDRLKEHDEYPEVVLEYDNKKNNKKYEGQDELNGLKEKLVQLKNITEVREALFIKSEKCTFFGRLTNNTIPRVRNYVKSCLEKGGIGNELMARLITVIVIAPPFFNCCTLQTV